MSRPAMARRFAWMMVLVLPMTLAGSLAGSASAAPGDPGDVTLVDNGPNATGLVLPWSALGLPSSVSLFGEGASGYTVALPDGLAAVRLQGTVHAPINIDGGYLEIDDSEGKFLGGCRPAPGGLRRGDDTVRCRHIGGAGEELRGRPVVHHPPARRPGPILPAAAATPDQ